LLIYPVVLDYLFRNTKVSTLYSTVSAVM